ncbi:nuclear transport factor 2 family protein [Streptomyces sp. NBC_00083]|uniref:nuclear transport factor 2 family protein n=1 Tax=Streptomyces sp. NBC_00083 TaxID=2975647 RepID=UPI00225B573E|nr:nuclear transport factor 2 family protein [Streptomyces sp. NBC_00083]MCX5388249.1 nuclear transport factor 2 family protein [Streptomyces sp. NBC_00083]
MSTETVTAAVTPAAATPATETGRAVVLGYMDTLTTGDFSALSGFFAPDATWTLAGDLPLSRTWTGPQEILGEFIPAMVSHFVPESMEFAFEGVIADGERVFAEWNTRALTTEGARYDQHCLAVFTVRDGRIVAVREYIDTLHAKNVVFV